MMHATMLFSLAGVVGSLAAGSMVGTWRRYAAAWDAIAHDMRAAHAGQGAGAGLARASLPVVSDERMGGLVYLPLVVNARPQPVRPELRAAA